MKDDTQQTSNIYQYVTVIHELLWCVSDMALFVAFFSVIFVFTILALQYQINIALFVALLKFFPLYIG